MSATLLTIAIAFFFVAMALTFLGIGKIITGRTHLKAGMCGKLPENRSKDCKKNVSCSLCSHEDEK